jgi:transposase-like protein
MTYKKLSEAEKQQVLQLYQTEAETIPRLSEQFGVSSTTIRRLLKGGSRTVADDPADTLADDLAFIEQMPLAPEPAQSDVNSSRRSRRRSSSAMGEIPPLPVPPLSDLDPVPDPVLEAAKTLPDIRSGPIRPILKKQASPPEAVPVELADLELELDDLELDDLDEGEDEDLKDEDLEDDFGDDEEGDSPWQKPHLQADGMVHVLPIAQASLPKTCYLVVDRMAELITRPLKDFGELGQFPEAETQQKTLPVFDNHRIARRFSNRTQRVIKVPNGSILQTTSPHLHAKGITRLLVNGQVYALEAFER